MRAVLIALLLGYAIAIPAGGVAAETCGVSAAAQTEWPTATPGEAGFDAALLCSIDATLDKSPQMKIHAVVVIRHGKLVYETYRSGADNKWGEELGTVAYSAEMPHDMRSISKSVVSLLVGIALDRKLITSIDAPALAFFHEAGSLRTPQKDAISLRHLLTMQSGFAWNEDLAYDDPGNSRSGMLDSVNPYRFVLGQDLRSEPGTKWNYSGGDTQLLAGILQRTSGEFLADFAKEALFGPLGITDFEWMKMAANGEAAAESGLRLRPRDMAKIGKLVLDKGMWNGRRIVSQEWIDESTMTHVTGVDDKYGSIGYAYQWWTDHEKLGERDISWISAHGYGGQRLYVVPALDLVVAITAGLYGEESQDWVSFDILDKFVLAAIRN